MDTILFYLLNDFPHFFVVVVKLTLSDHSPSYVRAKKPDSCYPKLPRFDPLRALGRPCRSIPVYSLVSLYTPATFSCRSPSHEIKTCTHIFILCMSEKLDYGSVVNLVAGQWSAFGPLLRKLMNDHQLKLSTPR